ncbi:hypothetical protein [Desulfobotulus sp.]|uniref:hypothetical protein n=1 Tax=Desulfobotulus sp. TaxID=1940337 RepID=UPI002A360135|nr:hypothetical protein [Desulfobotulus sp.]MDY0163179.1 hypothetical protein [Desulfobotulus sp.]
MATTHPVWVDPGPAGEGMTRTASMRLWEGCHPRPSGKILFMFFSKAHPKNGIWICTALLWKWQEKNWDRAACLFAYRAPLSPGFFEEDFSGK